MKTFSISMQGNLYTVRIYKYNDLSIDDTMECALCGGVITFLAAIAYTFYIKGAEEDTVILYADAAHREKLESAINEFLEKLPDRIRTRQGHFKDYLAWILKKHKIRKSSIYSFSKKP